MSESWEQKTARWAAEGQALEKREAALRRHAGAVHEPRAGEPLYVEAGGRRLMVKRIGSGDFFAKVEGDAAGRFGRWSQIKADIGYFVLNHGASPHGRRA